MHWKGLKIPIILFSLLIGLTVIFSAQFLLEKYRFNNPLNQTLSSNKSVESFAISNEGEQIKIVCKFKNTVDLMSSYTDLQKEINEKMGRRSFYLVLEDNRDESLHKAWENSHLAIYQAVAQGSYQSMAETIKSEAIKVGAEAKVSVDQNNVYVRMKKDDMTLDEVIARDKGQFIGSVNGPLTGGGVSVQGS